MSEVLKSTNLEAYAKSKAEQKVFGLFKTIAGDKLEEASEKALGILASDPSFDFGRVLATALERTFKWNG